MFVILSWAETKSCEMRLRLGETMNIIKKPDVHHERHI